MGLYLPSYKYSFSSYGGNEINCKFYVKLDIFGEEHPVPLQIKESSQKSFTRSQYKVIISMDGKLLYCDPSYFQDEIFYDELVSRIDFVSIGSEDTYVSTLYSPLQGKKIVNLDLIHGIKIYLKSNINKSVTVEFISKKPKVPWLRWESFSDSKLNFRKVKIPGVPLVPNNGFVSTNVLPASAIRVSQTIAQNTTQRALWVAISASIVSGSSSVSEGFGAWNYYNNSINQNLEKISFSDIVDNSSLNMSLYFRMKFISQSLDLHAPFIPTLVGVMTPSATVPLASVLVPSGVMTIESQRLRYLYIEELKELSKRINDSFSAYTKVFENKLSEEEKEYFNKEKNTYSIYSKPYLIIDRLYELSLISTLKIQKTYSPYYFSNPLNDGVELRENGISELIYLINNYSIINRTICLKKVSGISRLERTPDFDVYKIDHIGEDGTGNVNYYLINEDRNNKFVKDVLLNVDAEKEYTIFCKCILVKFLSELDLDFYNRNDLGQMLGTTEEVCRWIRDKELNNHGYSEVSNAAGETEKKEIINVYLLLRAYKVSFIVNPNVRVDIFEQDATGSDKYHGIYHVPEIKHHDRIVENKSGDSTVNSQVIFNVPMDDTSLENVGVNVTDIYHEIVPGFGLKTRTGHGISFIPSSSNSGGSDMSTLISPGGITKIFGTLETSMVQFNPYHINDIVNNKLEDGSYLEIISNMGQEKDATSSDEAIPSVGLTEGLSIPHGLLGGDLNYIVYTVTEYEPSARASTLIAYKNRVLGKYEHILFTKTDSEELYSFNVLGFNIVPFELEKEFSIKNSLINSINNERSIFNYSLENVISINDYNIRNSILKPFVISINKLFSKDNVDSPAQINPNDSSDHDAICIIVNPTYLRLINIQLDMNSEFSYRNAFLKMDIDSDEYEAISNLDVIQKLSKVKFSIKKLYKYYSESNYSDPESYKNSSVSSGQFFAFYINKTNMDVFDYENETDILSKIDYVGYYNSAGLRIPKIFNLSVGVNEVDLRNLDDVAILFFVPCVIQKKETNKIDKIKKIEIGEIGENNWLNLYEYKDDIIKTPLDVFESMDGNYIYLFSAYVKDDPSKFNMILAAEVNPRLGIATYPKVYVDYSVNIEPNGYAGDHIHYELLKNHIISQSQYVQMDAIDKNKYLVLGALTNPQVILDYSNSMAIFVGFLYDETFTKKSYLASLSYSFASINSGLSVLEMVKALEPVYDNEYPGRDISERTPLFYYDGYNLENTCPYRSKEIVNLLDGDDQKMAIFYQIQKNNIFVFLIDDTRNIVSFRSNNFGLEWHKNQNGMYFNFLIEEGGSKEVSIEINRICCLKYPHDATMYFAFLCKIGGSNEYQILFRKVSLELLSDERYWGDKDFEKRNKRKYQISGVSYAKKDISSDAYVVGGQDITASKVYKLNDPLILVVGDISLIVNRDNSKVNNNYIEIGNYTIKDGVYSPNGAYKDDLSGEEVKMNEKKELNINSLQNIDMVYDHETNIIKIFYFNNKGIRDCVVSMDGGNSWHPLVNF